MMIAESNLHMLSPTGRSKMWDAGADGYARGEGIAAVVLKPLSAALRDGDPINCVIRGTGGAYMRLPLTRSYSVACFCLRHD